jgi:hypothetical protein
MSETQADAPPTMAEIDALLDETGGDLVTPTWTQDRPLLPREAMASLRRHQTDPATLAANARREVVRAAADQLRMQADAFRRCRAALLAGDPAMIPDGNPPGSGFAEARELLTEAAELAVLMREPAARASLAVEHEGLAVAFGAAAERCAAAAEHIDDERLRLHGRDYLRLIEQRLREDAEEAERRKRSLDAEAGQ